MDSIPIAPLVTRKNAAGEIYLTITVTSDNILSCEWVGFITSDQIKEVILEILELQTQHNVHCILHDLTRVTGTWSQAIPWLVGDFQPIMRNRLQRSYGAIVLGNSIFSNMSAKELVSVYPNDDHFRTELFAGREEAFAWLRNF